MVLTKLPRGQAKAIFGRIKTIEGEINNIYLFSPSPYIKLKQKDYLLTVSKYCSDYKVQQTDTDKINCEQISGLKANQKIIDDELDKRDLEQLSISLGNFVDNNQCSKFLEQKNYGDIVKIIEINYMENNKNLTMYDFNRLSFEVVKSDVCTLVHSGLKKSISHNRNKLANNIKNELDERGITAEKLSTSLLQ